MKPETNKPWRKYTRKIKSRGRKRLRLVMQLNTTRKGEAR